jgi:phosphate-selective porin OprO and OprP
LNLTEKKLQEVKMAYKFAKQGACCWAQCFSRIGRFVAFFAVVAALNTLVGVCSLVAAEKTVTEQILDILKQEGKISDEKYQELTAKAQEEKGKDTDFNVYWKDGLRFESNDGQFTLQMGGRVMVDWANIDADNPMRRDIERKEGNTLEGSGVEFRRARVFVAGTIYDAVDFKAEYDFADGDTDFNDVYLGLSGVPYVGSIRVGHVKEPFSLEQQTSSNYITFMERALPAAFVPARNTGFLLKNAVLDKRMTWSAGVFQDADDFGNSFNDFEDWNVTGRLTGLPWYEEEGRQLLHLGLSYTHQFRDENDTTVRYRERPESHITDAHIVNTGSFAADAVDIVNPEAALVFGPFSLQGEYFYTWVNSQAEDDPEFDGFYIYGSYFLTGENRNYSAANGAFDRVKPKANFHPTEGGWGAWEIGLRYSNLDLSDGNVNGGEADNFTAGLNWYLNPNVRWMTNYVYSDLENRENVNDDDLNILQTRFQIDF